MRSDNCKKKMQQFVDSRAQQFVDTYNSRLKKRYENDPSIYPDIDSDQFLEVGLSDGLDIN